MGCICLPLLCSRLWNKIRNYFCLWCFSLVFFFVAGVSVNFSVSMWLGGVIDHRHRWADRSLLKWSLLQQKMYVLFHSCRAWSNMLSKSQWEMVLMRLIIKKRVSGFSLTVEIWWGWSSSAKTGALRWGALRLCVPFKTLCNTQVLACTMRTII